ncbi:hypothetical protein QJS10_CPA03g00545 [Acorus calamus]|uniref:Uncharacterized protein n=1 Tax=Acorus calamus TaxID=4465 RepID=A0AAV9F8Y9_ACOCL|nr:hypothetical protein QJS10_CPA03g00545 [Acorus calamus]
MSTKLLNRPPEQKHRSTLVVSPPSRPPLHNFDLPLLKWGNQRLLRCMKVVPDGVASFNVPDRSPPPPPDKPWNLRTRRNAASPDEKSRRWSPPSPLTPRPRPPRPASAAVVQYRSLRLRGIAAAEVADLEGERAEKKRKSKEDERSVFRISLSRAEVEADILALTGLKPPKRPNKRPKFLQRELDSIYPGLRIPKKLTQDTYKINDAQ